MPKALETKLFSEAKAKGYDDERTRAYVYGTLRKTGWKPKRERKAKTKVGEAFEKGHRD